MTDSQQPLREQLSRALDWQEAHLDFDKALQGFQRIDEGYAPPGFDHSAWELVEHMRIAQNDLLDFCVNGAYAHALNWPDNYWPRTSAPSESEWDAAIATFHADRAALKTLTNDRSIDLFARVPTGTAEQTYLRSILLVIDHNAYHLGQLVAVRQALAAAS